jgi:hypothetical protein
MNLLARLVSRRVRELETQLDVQRAQTLTWHQYHAQMENKRNRVLRHLRHALEGRDDARVNRDAVTELWSDAVRLLNAARAETARYRLAYLSAAKRASGRRLSIAVLRAGLASGPVEPRTYGLADIWVAEPVEVWRRRALAAEANCARYEDRLAALEDRPVVVAR